MIYPLLLPAASLAGGILAGCWVSFKGWEIAAYVTICAGLAVLAQKIGSFRLAKAALSLAFVFTGIGLENRSRPGAPPSIDAQPREVLLFEGCVVEPPAMYADRQQFVLELEPGARVRVNLFPAPGQAPPKLEYGQRVSLEARLRRPRNFGNPGAFDYVRYLALRKIYWTASAGASANLKILPGRCGSSASRFIYRLRSAALDRLEKLYAGRPYHQGMLQAMLIGERSKMDRNWTEQFRITGTYHALVISGLHLTALTGMVFFVLRLLPAGELLPLVVAGLIGWLYCAVTGFQTPVLRAASGLTLYFIARFFYRRARLLNVLAAVALVFLAVDPQQLFDASFQLSFLSVLSIGALAVPLIERTSIPYRCGLSGLADRDRDLHLPPAVASFRVELRLLSETLSLLARLPARWAQNMLTAVLRVVFYGWELFLVSACVQIGLAVPMATYFHRFSFSAFAANLAVAPLISLVVPAGLVAVVTGWSAAASLAGGLLTLAQKVVEWNAGWDPGWRVPPPPAWLGVGVAVSLSLAAFLGRKTARWRSLPIAGAGLLLALLVLHPFPPQVEAGKLELTAIDVGQGDSLFIALPAGRLMLLDAGGTPGRRGSGLDIGEDVVSPYLWARSIRRLDVVAVSHFHEDHAGGIPAVAVNFRPRELWIPSAADPAEAKKIENLAGECGAALRRLAAGDHFEYGGARFTVLAPAGGVAQSGDNVSLVLRLSYGERSFLLTGDLAPAVERMLALEGSFDRADVLKVPHHGSRFSTRETLLTEVRPVFALISVGFENPYRHPHPETIERLHSFGAVSLRTDLAGRITVRTDGRRLEVDTERSAGFLR